MLIQKTTVTVIKGNMLRQDVDAVVNAANEGMRGGAGIDGRIHEMAGKDLLAELTIVAPKGAKTGTAVITGGHGLSQPYIIHTPGPRWNHGKSGEAELLASSYHSCLERAEEKKLTSIAFCSLSTGIFGYPLDKAAPIAVKTVQDYLDAHTDTSLERIIFAMRGKEEYEAFAKAYAEATA